MQIQVVGMKEGLLEFSTPEEMLAAANVHGWTPAGTEDQKHLLPHLQGMPKFKELAGPMGNGNDDRGQPRVRYETWAAYEIYSR